MAMKDNSLKLNLSQPRVIFYFDFQNYSPADTLRENVLYRYPDGVFDIRRFEIEITQTMVQYFGLTSFSIPRAQSH